MSNITHAEEVATRLTGTTGNQVSTTPSVGKKAKQFDPDRPVWERQPTESAKAYAAFVAWRDTPERKLPNRQAQQWSAIWSWGYRAYEFDLYLSRKETEDLIRYRLAMNARQRDIAYVVQQQVIQWLASVDPRTMKPAEAARWLEVAVRIERLAAGADTERATVNVAGRVGVDVRHLSAEETEEALAALQAEIESLTGQS